MTLDEAIAHADEVAGARDTECRRDHKQLADWLRELKGLRDGSGRDVWLLLSTSAMHRRARPGERQIETRAALYATREGALDALREFMRPDVNASRTDEEWEDSGELVDDALDFILDYLEGDSGDGGYSFWTWCGPRRYYEWALMKLEAGA